MFFMSSFQEFIVIQLKVKKYAVLEYFSDLVIYFSWSILSIYPFFFCIKQLNTEILADTTKVKRIRDIVQVFETSFQNPMYENS